MGQIKLGKHSLTNSRVNADTFTVERSIRTVLRKITPRLPKVDHSIFW